MSNDARSRHMTAEVDLLPLPDGYDKYDPPLLYEGQMFNDRQMQDYARANVEHAIAPLRAEVEALRAGVERLHADRGSREQKTAHPAITHCDNCGCDWLDSGLNPIGCPYCKQHAQAAGVEALRELDELEEAARLLGATQAKRLFGCYTDEDRRFERAMRESMAKHRAALCELLAEELRATLRA